MKKFLFLVLCAVMLIGVLVSCGGTDEPDHLANADFYVSVVGGTLTDGFSTGLYPAGADVTLVASEMDAEGNPFSHWENSAGEMVSEEAVCTVQMPAAHETYRAVYGQPTVSADWLLFTELSDGTYSIKANPEAELPAAIAIPETYNGAAVTVIEEAAFEGLTGIMSVTIPNGVQTIGSKAFWGCSGLQSLLLPNTVTNIGTRAFQDCSALMEFTVPSSVTSIGTQIFYGCDSLTKVCYNAAYSDSKNPFLDVWCLTHIEFGGTSVPNAILSGKQFVKEVIIHDSVTNIGENAFSYCKGLTSIIIPDSVTSIGFAAFEDCTSLTDVTIGNGVTSIGEAAFLGCTGLTSITIPGVTSIGDSAFSGCTGLTSITIPDSVINIGNEAFYKCIGLTDVTIGNGVASFERSAFFGCTGLTSLTVEPGNANYYSSGNCLIEKSTRTLILGCKNSVIPTNGSVTSIGDSAFSGCTGLTSITIPDSVTSIGSYAFFGCTGLTSITIPNSVTSIGEAAFSRCTGLTNIYYGGSSAEWAAVTKGNLWDYNTGDYTVSFAEAK